MSVVHINTFCSTFACAKHLKMYPCIWCLIYEESVYKLTDTTGNFTYEKHVKNI